MQHGIRRFFRRNDAVLCPCDEFVNHGLRHTLFDAILVRLILERRHGDYFKPRRQP